jgi:hypothetical protein
MGRMLILCLILNVVVRIVTTGLVKLKVRHGKTTYSVKESRSVWICQIPDFDTAPYRAFLVHISQWLPQLPVRHFHSCKSAYLLAKGPSILYAILQFLYYHQKVSATVINTAPVLLLSSLFSFDSACSPLPAVYKTSSNKETYCSHS